MRGALDKEIPLYIFSHERGGGIKKKVTAWFMKKKFVPEMVANKKNGKKYSDGQCNGIFNSLGEYIKNYPFHDPFSYWILQLVVAC